MSDLGKTYTQSYNDWLDEHDKEIRYDERKKTLNELENKLKIWDNGVRAIPNYVWKCIRELKPVDILVPRGDGKSLTRLKALIMDEKGDSENE